MELTQAVKDDIKEFLRLDDGLKDARVRMKESRDAMNDRKERIIVYMRKATISKLVVRKGEQTLFLQEKELKIRPDATVVRAKLQELMRQGVTDPEKIFEEINKCGGSKTVWRLMRRAKRVAPKKKDEDQDDAEPEEPGQA